MEMTKKEIIAEAHRVLLEESNAIAKVIDYNNENLAVAVELLANANKVICTGVGKSGLIAQKIASTFSSLGIPAIFLHPVEALHGDIGSVQKGDVTIMLSKSGATEELITLFPFLESRTKIISIVSNRNSFLAKKSAIFLDATIEKEACAINLAPTTSTTVALAIGDALAACLVKVKNFSAEDFSLNHPLGQLGKNLTLRVEHVMHSGKDLPIVSKNDSFKDAIVEITQKNLGCVCVLDGDKLCGIITDGDVRRALAKIDSLASLSVENVMTANPISIQKDVMLGDALGIMEHRKSQINVLPVVDSENKCIGVVRLHDIVKSSN